ncbi:MAG: DUF4412 domain-containing protein, partial [Bacteroidota bacterium]
MKKVFLLIGIILFVHIDVNAQLGGVKRRLERKLEERLAKKAADKIEEKIDEKIAEEEAKNGKKKKDKGEDDDRPSIFDMGSLSGEKPEAVLDAYSFDFQIDWRISSNSKDMEEPMDMTQLYSTDAKYMGMKGVIKEKKSEQSFMNVMDFENEFFVTLLEEEKQGVVMAIPDMSAQMEGENEGETPEDFKLEKTSETKDILGYSCTKYIFSSDDMKGEYWLTTELDYQNFDMFNYFKNMAKQNGMTQNASYQTSLQGFMLETKAEDKDGTITHMLAT